MYGNLSLCRRYLYKGIQNDVVLPIHDGHSPLGPTFYHRSQYAHHRTIQCDILFLDGICWNRIHSLLHLFIFLGSFEELIPLFSIGMYHVEEQTDVTLIRGSRFVEILYSVRRIVECDSQARRLAYVGSGFGFSRDKRVLVLASLFTRCFLLIPLQKQQLKVERVMGFMLPQSRSYARSITESLPYS